MAVNDIGILLTIGGFFILLGFFLPYINAEFGGTDGTADVDKLQADLTEDTGESWSILSAPGVFGSMILMFFWTFGALPAWLDTIFLILRVTFFTTLARNIWIGGGG